MQIRLPFVLSGMGLLLLAGLAAVAVLEQRRGGAAVPGLVIVDQPELPEAELAALIPGWPGARLEWVPAGPEALSPFDGDRLAQHRSQGYHTTLLVPSGAEPPEGAWDLRTRSQAYRASVSSDLVDLMIEDLSRQIRSHPGTRPFALALAADPIDLARLAHLGRDVLAQLRGLPSYRRSSLVILGERRAGRRVTLRIDVGRWGERARPALTDLLEPGW